MAGASIETTLELWASSLRAVKALIRPLFTQERVAVSAGLFLDGVLGDERRKTGWMRAEAAGTQALGASRPFWAAVVGMLMRCAISYAAIRPVAEVGLHRHESGLKSGDSQVTG
jgi:hypothetical protein